MRQRIYSKLRKGWDRDKYNAEGYKDMTAYLALKRVEREERGKRKAAKVRAGRRACREDERFCREELANGIIIQAAQDWRAAMAILRENPEDPEARETVRETESFFLSEYYATLTKVDGAWLLGRLKDEFPSVEVQPKYSEDDAVRRSECSIRVYDEIENIDGGEHQ